MPPSLPQLARSLGAVLLAGLCASGSCSISVSSGFDDCDCDDCDDCGCDGCSGSSCSCGCGGCGDLELDEAAPPPVEVLVIGEDGSVESGFLLFAPPGR